MEDYFVDYSVEQIAASLAHEVKNPLSLVQAHLQLIELDDDSKHTKSYNILYKQLKLIDSLVSEFINLAKPSALNLRRMSFNELMNEIISTFDVVFANKNILLEYKNDIQAEISGDFSRLNQVFINIIKNAIEALENSDKKIISIDVSGQNGFVVTKISDSGPGIEPDALYKIGKTIYTTKKNGNGFGISNAAAIIQKHGGSIHIENNGGCSVTISLPEI